MIKYLKRLLLAVFNRDIEQQSTNVHKIEYYDSAETYPFKRSLKFYKFLAQDSEIGDNPVGVIKRLDLAWAFLTNDQIEECKAELSNLRLAWSYMVNEYSPIGAAAAISVKSINGVPCDDTTTDGLLATLKKLSDIGLTREDIDNKVEEIKKKSNWNWRFFTSLFFTGKMQSTIQL